MELWKKLKETNKPIVLYGMGNGADRILDVMEERGIQASGVFASDDFVRHQTFRGFTVQRYDELKTQLGEMVILLAFGTHRPEVLARIRALMGEQEVYAPDVPVAGNTLFDESFFKLHRADFEAVYQMLADNRSKFVFENVIRSKLTGEIEPLFACESSVEEAWGLFDLGEQESYLDLGAYTGDTVDRFLRFTKGKYQKIWAVEPDVKNYKRLLKNTENLRVSCLNCCVDEKPGRRYYAMDGGRKSHAMDEAGLEISARTVDEILMGESVSLVKMDVEGMEAAALKGAIETICRCRPSMQISAYHRSEDLFALPLLVEKICPGASVYLRHFSCLPSWDTDFYFKF